MIFNLLITIVLGLINLLFAWVPALPSVPEQFRNSVSSFFDLLFSNSGLVPFFLPMDVVRIAIPIILILINFKYIYSIFMWLIKKLPWSID